MFVLFLLVLTRFLYDTSVEVFQAFSRRCFWRLQACGGEFPRVWFDEDRAIGEDDRGDATHSSVDPQHLGCRLLIGFNIDRLIRNGVCIESPLRPATITTPGGGMHRDFLGMVDLGG